MKKLMLRRGCGGLAGRRARTGAHGEDRRRRHQQGRLRPGRPYGSGRRLVTWTNKDTANHQVVCATCPFTSPVLAAGQTFTFTFTKAGKFATVDPLNKNKKVDGHGRRRSGDA